jgi:hypothetical protein
VATCVLELRIPIPIFCVLVCFGKSSVWILREGESWILMALTERREESEDFERRATLQHWQPNFAFSTAKGLGVVLTSAGWLLNGAEGGFWSSAPASQARWLSSTLYRGRRIRFW